MKLKPMVIHVFHAIQQIAFEWQERQVVLQAENYKKLQGLQKGAIIVDEFSSFTQEQIDFLASKGTHV